MTWGKHTKALKEKFPCIDSRILTVSMDFHYSETVLIINFLDGQMFNKSKRRFLKVNCLYFCDNKTLHLEKKI